MAEGEVQPDLPECLRLSSAEVVSILALRMASLNKPNKIPCKQTRPRQTYIQASTSPKVVIFLMDVGDGMKNKMELAKKTVKLFLDTLTDEDYFNVIFVGFLLHFSSTFNYAELCFNFSLLLASNENKNRVVTYIDNYKWFKSKTSYDDGVKEALKLISTLNNSMYMNHICERSLVMLTSMLTSNIQTLISDINRHPFFKVKPFIYLLGKDKSSRNLARDIACSNGGFHARIDSDEQIFEQLLNFITVLSNSSITSNREITWTNIYEDTAGLDLIFTIAKPVQVNKKFIGVVGVDVAIVEFERLFNSFQLGVDAYGFIITESGNVVYHPELKAKIKEAMMRRETAYMNINSVGLFDNFKRVNMRRGNCFFTPIDHTSFRQYCSFDLKEKMNSRSETLYHQLKIAQTNSKIYTEKCNEELVMNLLYDIEATRGASNSWMKENWDSKHAQIRSDGVDMVYFGTKGGLTRYFVFNQTNQELFEDYLEQTAVSTSQSLYYKRAINGGEDVFTFSLPFLIESSMNNGDSSSSYPLQYQPPSHLYSANMDDILISASAPVVIHNDVSEGVVGVVGLLMRYSQFRQILNETSISLCRLGEHQPCVKTCESELGYFLGELEGCAPRILKDLIIRNEEESNLERDPNQDGYHHHHHLANLGDATKNSGIFNKIEVTDHQAVCEIIRKSSSNSEALSNNLSFTVLLNKLVWILSEVYIFMSHIGSVGAFFGFKQTTNETTPPLPVTAFDEVPPDLETYRVLMTDLMKISSAEQAGKWKDNCMRQSGFNADVALACLRSIKKAYEPGILGFRPCIQSYTRYEREKVRLPQNGRINKKERDICTKPYLITDVPHTNLMLLATDTTCMCEDTPTISSRPVEVVRDPAAMEGTCDKLTFDPNVQQLRPTTSSSVPPSLSSSTSKCSVRVQHEDDMSWNQDETSQSETGSHFCGDGVSIHDLLECLIEYELS
ncbi:hypothetical protein HELRODRAFT_174990 [Helobdella robusta]|uniref:VWFA domain-containing protein n=1 Tax=Helobdella robusta TaxID=6412 RepID=T1F8P7_HELRO|nr:hypothetical protein HELRODRAFT_174990 [Helobdella robusta]ESO01431.1 hypothetical protein HELRODRAFT_174990 [Helobdella robusta]